MSRQLRSSIRTVIPRRGRRRTPSRTSRASETSPTVVAARPGDCETAERRSTPLARDGESVEAAATSQSGAAPPAARSAAALRRRTEQRERQERAHAERPQAAAAHVACRGRGRRKASAGDAARRAAADPATTTVSGVYSTRPPVSFELQGKSSRATGAPSSRYGLADERLRSGEVVDVAEVARREAEVERAAAETRLRDRRRGPRATATRRAAPSSASRPPRSRRGGGRAPSPRSSCRPAARPARERRAPRRRARVRPPRSASATRPSPARPRASG